MAFENAISDDEITAISEAIYKRYGIDFTNYEIKSLKRGFARLITRYETGSFIELWEMIMQEPKIIPKLVDDLTVNLTDLFRNEDAWDKISNDLLEKFKFEYSIKILHAGCSSGEEVYSMAMMLKQKQMLLRSNIKAVDLSRRMIEQAKKGMFSKAQMKKYFLVTKKQFDIDNVAEYFNLNEDGSAQVCSDLKRKIHFSTMNLVSDNFTEKEYHLVFCRNVMIYFDDGLKMKVLKKIHSVLRDDGFFIIGYYDSLPIESKELFKLHDARSKIFVKA